MCRQFFAILSALSMALCAAIILLWGRSYFESDACTAPNGGYYRLSSNRGVIEFAFWAGALPQLKFIYFEIGKPPFENQNLLLGFSAHRFEWAMLRDEPLDDSPPPVITEITFPHWAAALLAIIPAIWWRSRNQHPPGTCPSCGYDLRATPTRCPECGEVP